MTATLNEICGGSAAIIKGLTLRQLLTASVHGAHEWSAMNGTHVLISLGGYVDVDKYRYVYFVVFLTLYVLILYSNGTIIYLILSHRNLHEPMYIFIAALSLNSLLFSTAIYPKLIADVLSHRQSISHSACMLQLFLFYALGASDFFLLSVMAYDRYVSICKPLHYATTMRPTNVTIFLALAWFLPGCQVAVGSYINGKQKLCRFVSGGIFCNNTVNKLHCVRSETTVIYGVFVFISIVVLPVLFILFTYVKIFLVACCRCGGAWEKAVETCLPHLMVLVCFSCLAAFDVIVEQTGSELPKTVRLIMMLQIVVYHPLFNPIIYGVKMKEIWKHIKKVFRHHIK
ncbi:LOW QUALITY PROTEIN: olfactory receptor 4X2-like [Hippocampus zosterae]|uniref:LOW QUALITY PROTEIN: olfactory receptor 4X2-like n=1 Tax=Hippocampus zosterae TaxID=109293 RepID=UPI00223DF48B|nr:LOW QUALITY PROTEIN: olfactory receptor 4X2-like [Hippocampus zosterae]